MANSTGGSPPAGYWVSNGDGLWHFARDPSAELTANAGQILDPSHMVAASSPVARHVVVKDGQRKAEYRTEHRDEVGGLYFALAGTFKGESWCTSHYAPYGDSWEICFDSTGDLVTEAGVDHGDMVGYRK